MPTLVKIQETMQHTISHTNFRFMLLMCLLQTSQYFKPSLREAGTKKRKKKVRRKKRARRAERTKLTIALRIKWSSLY